MRPANTTIVTLASEVARSLIGFLVTIYLARVLGPSVLGTFFLVVALIVWLKVPMNAVGSALTKRVSEGRDGSSFLGAGGVLYAGLTTLMIGIVLVADEAVTSYVGEPVAWLLAVLLVGNAAFSYVTCSLDGQKQVASSSILKATENIFEGGAQVAFVLLGYKLAGLVGGQVVALIVGGLVGLLLFTVRPSFPGRDHVASLAEYARYSWLGTLSGRTFGWMDTLVLGLFVSSGLVGVYEISWRIASVLILLSNAIQRTIFPEISNLAESGDESKVRFFVDEALFYGGLTAIPGLFGAALLGTEVLRIYGAEFADGATILIILIFAQLLSAYGNLLMTAVNGLDRPDIAFRINGVFMLSNLVLNLGLIYWIGWYGAAIATTASGAITALLALFAIRRLIGGVPIPVAGISYQVAASVVMTLVLIGGRLIVPIESMYYTVAYVGLGAGVYGVCLYGLSERVRSKARSLLPAGFASSR